MTRRLLSFFPALAIGLCAGCATNPPAPASAAVQPSSSVPRELDRFESDVEDAFDRALSGSDPAPTGGLRVAWNAARPVLASDGAKVELLRRVDERLDQLSVAEGAVSPTKLARALNALSEPLDELFARYSPGDQPLLLRLDYLGRELLLDGLQARWDLAGRHSAAVDSVWKRIRKDPRTTSSEPAIASFKSHLRHVADATHDREGSQLVDASRALLEDVDGLEVLLLGA